MHPALSPLERVDPAIVPLAVDSSHIYWANSFTNSVGRADLDGQNASPSFITGLAGPSGVAVDTGHIYWTNFFTDTIGRAHLDGQHANQSFITGAVTPFDLAVTSG